ncbi:MAG: LysR family transcriptional regulator [Clostridiaceae bacterium]
MSLFSYRIFDAVAKQESFLKAAEIMNITPSAVSHSIASFEAKLGFPLFIRSRNGVRLTNEGKSLLLHVRALLSCEEQINQEAAQICGLEKGNVVLGTFNSICINWIPDIIKSFRSLYPNISVSVMQGDYEDNVYWAKMGITDIGFATMPAPENLTITPINKDRLLCITPKNFIPANPGFVTIDDIRYESFILQREGSNADTNAFISKYKLSLRPQFCLEDDLSIIAMVESGLGISIVPELVLKKVQFDINIYQIKPEEYRTIGILTNKIKDLSPAALKMYNTIISYLESRNLLNV